MEIITEAWQDKDNGTGILHVKEKRPFGATRGNTSVPQVPELVVRLSGSKMKDDKPRKLAVRARLWDYGNSLDNNFITHSVNDGSEFTTVRNGRSISIKSNVSVLGTIQNDGYSYCILKSAISRAARIICKRRYIAIRLDCVWLSSDGKVAEVEESIDPIRTCRLSISEKAMCPRLWDKGKRKKGQTNFQYNGNADIDVPLNIPPSMPMPMYPHMQHGMVNPFPRYPVGQYPGFHPSMQHLYGQGFSLPHHNLQMLQHPLIYSMPLRMDNLSGNLGNNFPDPSASPSSLFASTLKRNYDQTLAGTADVNDAQNSKGMKRSSVGDLTGFNSDQSSPTSAKRGKPNPVSSSYFLPNHYVPSHQNLLLSPENLDLLKEQGTNSDENDT